MATVTIAKAKDAHPLAAAVLRQLGGGRDAVDTAMDAARHGASCGFSGFTYYTETVEFAKRNRKAIADAVSQMADDLGEGGAIKLVQGFNCLYNPPEQAVSVALWGGACPDDLADDLRLVQNALAWFALEEVGRAILDLAE